VRGGVFAQRQAHQRDPIGRHALRDGAIHQFELLLVNRSLTTVSAMNTPFQNIRTGQILYTRIANYCVWRLAIAGLRFVSHAERYGRRRSLMRIPPLAALFEAQTLAMCCPKFQRIEQNPASCVRDAGLSYAGWWAPLSLQRRKREFLMSKKSTRADLACQALRQAIIEQALPRARNCGG